MKIRLDIGCGPKKKEGFIGIDKYDYGQDIVRDVDKGLPFSDNAVDEIYSSHFIEHTNDWVFLFNEIWRVCKDGATIILRYPTFDNERAFDPFHKIFFTDHFFRKITEPRKNSNKVIYETQGFKAKFTLLDLKKDSYGDSVVTLRCIKDDYKNN